MVAAAPLAAPPRPAIRLSMTDIIGRLEIASAPSRDLDADETEGRKFYRQRADALATAQINISGRIVNLRAREEQKP